MTKRKSTKRALLLSALSLLMCVSMLIGSTFAWFTDSVTSGRNTIMAGNLDVTLKYWDGSAYVDVTDTTKLFNDAALWEPGHTEVAYLEVGNAGSLALKYQLGVNVYEEITGVTEDGREIKLSDHLVFSVVDKQITAEADLYTREGAIAAAGNSKGLKAYNSGTTALPVGEKDYVALIIYMPETVGNEANHKTGTPAPSITMGTTLVATQYTAESDSFNNEYDKDAWADGFEVTTANDLQAAINAGETNIVVMNDITLDEAIVIPAAPTTFARRSTPAPITINLNGKNINITAAYNDNNATASSAVVNNGNVILTGNGTIKAINNYTVRNYGAMVIDGVSIENGVMNFADLTVESGNISNSRSGKHTIYGNNATLTINGGTFYNGNPGNAAIFSYAGAVTINGGEFSIADGTATLGWTSCLLDAQGNATYTINGGVINGEIRDYNKNTTVYGGIFTHNSVKNFLAANYQAVANTDGTYTVLKGDVVASDNAALENAIANGNSNIALGAGNFTMPATSGDVTISGTTDTKITVTTQTAQNVTLNGVTVVAGSYKGIQHSNKVVFENCVLKGSQFLYANEVIIKNCVIDLTETADYIWTYSAKNVTFDGCTFNTLGKAILMYNEGPDLVTNVTVKNCTFNTTASAGKAAIEIDSHYAANGRYTLTTENNTVDPKFTGEWKIKDSAPNNTTVNGVVYNYVADGLYKGEGATYYVYNANGLEKMNAMMADKSAGRDAVVNLLADIDFAGKTWKPVDSHADTAFELAELNGNGHTISNLTINGQAMFTRFAGTGDVVIKDITFDKATVNSNGNINTSILTVQTYQNVLLDNVDVKNSTITGGYKVAPLIGTVYNENASSITATLKNCDVSDTVVTATVYDFCTCGLVAFVYTTNNDYVAYENCSVTNVQLSAVSGGYNYHANIHYTSANTDDQVNEAPGVTVTNVTFKNI